MRALRLALAKVHRSTLSLISRRRTALRDAEPVVSFTFDDFPRSALENGGKILRSYGAHGTYYAAMGLMGATTRVGPQFCAADLESLQREGHELGSHTFDHVSCRSVALQEFKGEVIRGRDAVTKITGIKAPHNFAYPYGQITLRAKGRVGNSCASCRGIIPGINASPVDLNLLRANSLYSQGISVEAIERQLDCIEEVGGWLIFYTHDVGESPSAYGCTPAEFEAVVKQVAKRRCRIQKVAEVIAAACPATVQGCAD